MKLTFVDQIRLYRTPDGKTWGSGWGGYRFFESYLCVFESVRVICRVFPISSVDQSFVRCDGPGIEFLSPPLFSGPWEYLWHRPRLTLSLQSLYDPGSAYLLRVPSQLSFDFARILRRNRHPFGLIVVASPKDDFAPGATKSLLRPFVRYQFDVVLKRLCREAAVCAYVTKDALQRQYPSSCSRRVDGASDVWLGPGWYVSQPRTFESPRTSVVVVSVGSLMNMKKGVDTLIDAAALALKAGLFLRVIHAGEGQHRDGLIELARRRGVSGAIEFPGSIPHGSALIKLLDSADLYVLPSRAEGLPRSLVEAMARGLPSIGTPVGGIPEILPDQDLVPPDNPVALASKIVEVVTNPELMSAMSARNLSVARGFSEERLTLPFMQLLNGLLMATRADRP